MNYAVIDLASLAWLLPELDSTLKSARTHLASAHKQSGADFTKSMAAAKHAVHDALGALQVIEARGVVHYLETLEQSIAHCTSMGSLDAHAFAVLNEACYDTAAYLAELHSTQIQLQPVVLYAAYEAVQRLNPAQAKTLSYHPADLYFPGLTPRLARLAGDSPTPPGAAAMNISKVRNTYESLLLQVLKGTASNKELNNLSLIVGLVASQADQSHAYSFWKICQAAVQTLQSPHPPFELGLKRWLGRLNLQIQRLAAGSKGLSERLFREALFYIAVSPAAQNSTRELHQQVTACYRLTDSVPFDLKQRRYGNAVPTNPTVLLDKINALKLAWDEAAPAPTESEGIEVTQGMLLRRLRVAQQLALDVQLSLSEYHLPVLVSVAHALAHAADAVSESGQALHKGLGLEGAKAVLWIEDALKHIGQPSSLQTQQAQTLIARVQDSLSSDGLLPRGPDVAARGAQSEQAVMGDVVREAIATLGMVENQLDEYFRSGHNSAALEASTAPLAQCSSTLDLLGLPQVSLAIKAINPRIGSLIAAPQSADSAVFASLATQFSQITSVLDLFTRAPERAQADYVFDSNTGHLKQVNTASSQEHAHGFDSVETLSVQRRSDAQVLIKKLIAAPQDRDTRNALSQSLKALQDDAALMGDASLSGLASVSLAPSPSPSLVQDPTPDFVPNFVPALALNPNGSLQPSSAIDLQPPLQAQPSNEAHTLAQLNALLTLPSATPIAKTAPLARSEDDLYGIFLEEARGVLSDAQQLLQELDEEPRAQATLKDLRRSFHTLKGSSRMVGFKAFGDAAWHVEQVINTALAKAEPASFDLIEFMRGAQESLSVWLSQLDDALLHIDFSSDSANDSPDFTVASTVSAFVTKLAPYLQAIERKNQKHADLSIVPLASALAAPSLVLTEPPAAPVLSALTLTEPLLEQNPQQAPAQPLPQAIEHSPSPALDPALDLTPASLMAAPSAPLATAPIEPVRPKISLIANNEGLRPQDFIDKARSAVMQAKAIELNQPATPAPSLLLTPVQVSAAPAPRAEPGVQDTMVSIGPLRLPKPLYAIYLQEAEQHIKGLEDDLKLWHTQALRASNEEAYRHAHSLKGSAATIGFGVMKELAAPLEAVLQHTRDTNTPLLPADLKLLDGVMNAFRQVYTQFASGQYPSAQTRDIEALSSLLAQLPTREKPSTQAQLPAAPSQVPSTLVVPAPAPASVADSFTTPTLIPTTALPATPLVAATLPVATLPPEAPKNDALSDAATRQLLVQDEGPHDEIEPDIWPDFVQEADLIVPRAQSSLLGMTHDALAINDVRRDLHTLKGSARMAGAMRMGALLHAIESKFEKSLQAQAPFLSNSAHTELLDDYDRIREVYESLKNPAPNAVHNASPVAASSSAAAIAAPAPIASSAPAPFLNLMVQTSALLDGALSTPSTRRAIEKPEKPEKSDHPDQHDQHDQPAAPAAAPFSLPALQTLATLALSPLTALNPLPQPVAPPAPSAAPPPPPALALVALKPLVITPLVSPAAPATAETALALPALRMRTDVLDHLVNQASEISSSKGRMDQHVVQLRGALRELTDNVDRLRKQLREIEIQAESQMATRTELASTRNEQFDPLEFDRFTRFQELTRMLTESLNDMLAVRDSVAKTLMDAERELVLQNKVGKDLTQSLMRSRLIAFDAISDRLYRVVRQAARETGKQVALEIQGGHLSLDRSILERITGSLEHLLRNAVVHGIELPAVRSQRGKTNSGAITLHIKQQGNELELMLNDDGGGLPLTRIRDTAIAKGMLSAQSLPTVQQLTELIFASGFSTADTVTELAGRGVGMDVVRSDIVGLGGRITVATQPLQNTRFNIRIPLTLAINQVLMVKALDVQYAIPTSLIQTVVSVKPSDLAQAYSQKHIQQRALNYPFAHLAQLLNLASHDAPLGRSATVLLLSNGSDTVAVHVDQVLGNQETVVKPLSTLMMRIPGLSSATLLNDGKLCLILDPVQLWAAQQTALDGPNADQALAHTTSTLTATAGAVAPANHAPRSAFTLDTQRGELSIPPQGMVQVVQTRAPSAMPAAPLIRARKIVMVVDDSLTVRKVTQKLLLREGWEVLLAKDGIDALEQLQSAKPDIMLLDIEMPRMDGFDLTRNIRADGALKAIPIIMITSRIADKHRDHAYSLGVNAYMGKPYRDDELLAEMLKLTTVQ